MYLGLIAIAHYRYGPKEVFAKACVHSECRRYHREQYGNEARFCGLCGHELREISAGFREFDILADPQEVTGLLHYQNGFHCHYFVLDGEDARLFEKRLGIMTVYPLPGDHELVQIPENLDLRAELEQMRANHHQSFIKAGYDSVNYVFGFLFPETEEDD